MTGGRKRECDGEKKRQRSNGVTVQRLSLEFTLPVVRQRALFSRPHDISKRPNDIKLKTILTLSGYNLLNVQTCIGESRKFDRKKRFNDFRISYRQSLVCTNGKSDIFFLKS